MPNNTYNSTANTSWTCPKNAIYVVECWGGGGGGASYGRTTAAHGSNGGGGGAYAKSTVTCVKDTVYTIGVGQGGAGATTNNSNGTNGTNSQFNNSAVRAAFGGRGLVAGSTPGVAGTVANCIYTNVAYQGGNGATYALMVAGGGGGGASNVAIGNNASGATGGVGGGGGSNGGTGGASNTSGTASPDRAGGGGGGAGGNLGTTIKSGGTGNNGQIIITWNDWIIGSADTTQANAPCTGTIHGHGKLYGSSDTTAANANVTGHLSAHMPISGVSNGSCTPACSGTLVPTSVVEYISGTTGLSSKVTEDFDFDANPIWNNANWNQGIGTVISDAGWYGDSVFGNSNDPGSLAYYDGIFCKDQYSQTSIAHRENDDYFFGAAVRVSLNNGYCFGVDTNGYRLWKVVSSVYSLITSGSVTVADSDVFRLEIIGTTLRMFKNGVQVGTDQTDSDLSAGNPGVGGIGWDSYTANDNFEGGNLLVSGRLTAKGSLKGEIPLGIDIAVNGTFDGDTDWSKTSGWTITGEELVATSVPAYNGVTQSNGGYDVGKRYRIEYTITQYTSGSVEFYFGGGGTGNGADRSSVGTFVEYLVPETDDGYYGLGALGSGFTGHIDNLSIRVVVGSIVTGTLTGKVYLSGASGAVTVSDDFSSSYSPLHNSPDWDQAQNSMASSGGLAYPNTSDAETGAYRGGSFNPNQWAQVTITDATDAGCVGVALRSSSGNYYGFYYSNYTDEWWIFRCTPTFSSLLSGSGTHTTGDVLRLEIFGDILIAYKNGVKVGSITSSTITSGNIGIVGYGTGAANNTITDFQGGSLVSFVIGTLGTAVAAGAITGVTNGVASVSMVSPHHLRGTTDHDECTNGGFDADSDWAKGAGWTISDGVASNPGGNNYATLSQGSYTIGRRYSITFSITAYTSGTIRPYFENSLGTYRSAIGTYTEELYCDFDTLRLITGGTGFNGSIDNVSIRIIGGATITGVLKGKGRLRGCDLLQNLIPNSEELDADTWSHVEVAHLANQDYDVEGNLTLERLTVNPGYELAHLFSYGYYEELSVTPGDTYRWSFDVKRGTMTDMWWCAYDMTHSQNIFHESYYSQTSGTVTRISREFTVPAGCTHIGVYVLRDSGVNGTVFVGRCQLEKNHTPVYVKTGASAIDVTQVRTITGTLTGKGSLVGYTGGIELLTNHTFENSSNWNLVTHWTVGDNVLHASNCTLWELGAYQGVGDIRWKEVVCTMTIKNYSSGSVSFMVIQSGGSTILGTERSANGTYVESVRCDSTLNAADFRWQVRTEGSTMDFDDVYLMMLYGSTVTGTLTGIPSGGGAIAGVTNGVASVTGLIFFRLLGSSNGVATVSGTLVGDGKLYGIINGVSSVSVTLVGHCHPAGITNGVVTVSGTLKGHCHPAGITNGIASCSATLKGRGLLIGAINGVATISGVLHGHGKLYGIIDGVASCSATTVQGGMAGVSNGVASVTGLAFINLLGVVNGIATVSGTLTGKGVLIGFTGIGINLLDTGKGKFDSTTEGWVPYGTNSISNDADSLKIEFGTGGSQYGAYVYLRESSDLSQNLVVGKPYLLQAKVKVNAGATIYWQFLSSTTTAEIICQNTTWTWIQLQLIALISTTNTFRLRGLGTGEIAWVDEYYVHESLGSVLSGVLVGKGSLLGSSNGVASVSGTLYGHCYPAGISNGIASCSALLYGRAVLTGTTSSIATVTGSLQGHGKLYGTINGVASCSARPVQLTMIGQISGVATVTGLMFFRLHASSNGVAAVSATLKGHCHPAGVTNGVASCAGILKGYALKAGIVNGIAGCSASLHGHGKLYGTTSGVETTVGILKGDGTLMGAVSGVASLASLFGGTGTLIGLLGGVTVTAAELIGWGVLTGEIDGVALLTGDLDERLPGKCEGIINGVSLVGGTLPGWGDLTGVSNGVTVVTCLWTPLYVGEELLKPSLITTEIFEQSLITTELAWQSLITEEIGDELGGIALITFIDITNLGVVSSDILDQTDIIRTILNAGYSLPIRFPLGTYRCRNLYLQNNQQIIIDGTIKNIDGILFDITQDALEGQNIIYIEDATSDQLDFLEKLVNEAPDYYYYVGYFDDNYTIEGGGTDQIHHNAWVSRLTGVNKVSKYITMKDNIPTMPNYCGGTLHVVDNAIVEVLYNVFEVDECTNPKFSGSGTVDANRYNFVDLNPVWISGEEGHPEFAGSGANFLECFSVRFGYGFEMTGDIKLRDGKDNIMMWYMDGYIHLDGVTSYNAHNKNIGFIINMMDDFPDINCLAENCEADGSDYEDGFIGYTSADNLTIRNCVAKNCPRYGFSWNRWTSHGNYAENLEAYNCGNAYSFNRGGITDILTIRNIYYEGGGQHDKSGDYQAGVELRSQTAIIGGYEDIYNLGMVCDKQTYGILIMYNRNINLIWDATAPAKNRLCVGNLIPPHSYGYWLRIGSTSYNIVIDGGGFLEVNNFKYLFYIETGSTNIVIKNCNFSSYTNLGIIDSLVTFQNNWFKGVFFATGYPGVPLSGLLLRFDASLEVTRSGEDVSAWGDQSSSNNDATQITTALQPHYIASAVNGLPAIKGDGADDIMALANTIVCNGDFVVFVVIGGSSDPSYMWGHSSVIYTRPRLLITTWRNSTTHSFDHSNKPLTTGYFIHHMVRRSGNVRSYRNNVESLTGAIVNTTQYAIGKLFSYGTNFGVGAIAEFRLYENLSAPDEAIVLAELSTKYELY